MGGSKRKRSGGDVKPPASSDPPRKKSRTRGLDTSGTTTSRNAHTTVTLEVKPDNWYRSLPAHHAMDTG